jgi:hypothetical protein
MKKLSVVTVIFLAIIGFLYPYKIYAEILNEASHGALFHISPHSASTPAHLNSLTPTPTPNLTPSPIKSGPTPTIENSWAIQSVDAMKVTKDAVCYQRSDAWINKWASKAAELGANYVAISTPYDNPTCGNAVSYTKHWITAIRAHHLKVWHRQMPLAFEGIYNTPKSNSNTFTTMITDYIKAHPEEYQNGDIFTPIPEPQNGGIRGVTYCPQNICEFPSKEAFNKWLRDAMTASKTTFHSLGKDGIKIGYFGFDGFVAWGDNNPDWNGILEDATIKQMGNITIDHYPELVGDTMKNDLEELKRRYPGVPIIIGEWGAVTGGNVEQHIQNTMEAAKQPIVKGFNYWQFGPTGATEQLINDDFSNKIQFKDVQNFYKPIASTSAVKAASTHKLVKQTILKLPKNESKQ